MYSRNVLSTIHCGCVVLGKTQTGFFLVWENYFENCNMLYHIEEKRELK